MQDGVGRERELAALELFPADARDRTAACAPEGAAGIAKTVVSRVGVERR